MNKKMEDFSTGMWRLKVELVSFNEDKPKMDIADILPFLKEAESSEPLLVRIKGTYIPIYEGNSIPYKTVALPEEYQEFLNMDLPQEVYMLVPKKQEKMKSVLNPGEFGWELPDDEFNGGKVP